MGVGRVNHIYGGAARTAFSVGGRQLLQNAATGRIDALPPVANEVLAVCRRPGTWDQHLMAAEQAGVRPEDAVRTLEQLIGAKLIQRIQWPNDGPSRSAKPSAGALHVAIVTADRPAALRHSVPAVVDHAKCQGTSVSVLVVDGSASAEARRANVAAVACLCRNPDCETTYLGPREAARIRGRLRAAGMTRQPALLRGLTPGSIGANRNLALLLLAGRDFVFVDDDVHVETWSLPKRAPGMLLGGHGEMREITFFQSRAAAVHALASAPVNVLAEHERWLGAPLAHAPALARGPVDVQPACPHMLAQLQAGARGCIRVTLAGLAGDSGTYCPYAIALQSEAVRATYGSSREIWNLAVTSREVRRIARQYVVTHDPHCMAYCTGLSNRRLLPPFAPVGRNEDGVFGHLLAFADPDALFIHLPYGIVHDSDRTPAYRKGYMPSVTQTRVCELVEELIRIAGSSTFAESPADRLVRLGRMFGDAGRMKRAAFVSFVVDLTLGRLCRRLANLDEVLSAEPGLPVYIRSALDQYRTAFIHSVRRREFFVPIEFRAAGSIEAGYRALQAHLRDFGELLEAWPVLWAFAAKERLDED